MSELILLLVPDKLRVSSETISKIADILVGLGHICVGSIILPFIFDKPNERAALAGVIFALGSWALALVFVQKYHE